ncbi:MAG: glutamate-1-semialdehyde-2,1-aminomutase [Crenarchaeota archaeon 13_1_40CM_3_52_10]|nr:MAG: glutamate-1-semialdehyde-2,1-aminomutase [Crenarchaeota archaeon 13_1_40CM_3_52_10]OLE69622.1 MAG: glutamate-1-semialdehyde-2,1-aminomutase [archaeon 13_1_20CM_2_51_12]
MAGLDSRSQQLYRRAREVIPGGVNSPVRNYSPYPLFVASAKGAKFRTADSQEYLDYCMAYGALLDGHANPEIIEAVEEALEKGSIYGQPTEMEVELAELIASLMPSMEMVRLVNSGTEATMHAIRLARGFTGKKKVLKFEGGFHGSHDSVLVKAGSGATLLGSPSSEGVPSEVAKNTLVSRFNDEQITGKIIRDHENELAAVIVEPVLGNIGPILPKRGFLETLRKVTEENDVLLMFDEVITGFRLSLGGAQEYYKIRPDLTILGKALGGGLPLSAFGGRRDIMEKLSPLGPVYQAGTYSGNPVSVSAALATLQSLRKRAGQVYSRLEKMGDKMRRGIGDHLESARVIAQVNGLGSMFQLFFTDRPVTDYHSAKSADIGKYEKYFHSLLASRVFIPPSQFEASFLSTAHNEDELQTTLDAIGTAVKTLPR